MVYEKYPSMQPTDISQKAACIERLIHRHQRLDECDNATKLNDCLKLLTSSLLEKYNTRNGNGVSHSIMSSRRKMLRSKLGSERYRKALALCREFYLLRFTRAKRMSCARCEESTCEWNVTAKQIFSNPPLLYALEHMPLHDVSLTGSDQWDLWMKEMEEIVEKR